MDRNEHNEQEELMKKIDARGLACPAPVLLTKAAIEEEGSSRLTIIVDNEASRENVSLFLESKNFSFSVEKKDGAFYINGEGDAGTLPESPAVRAHETEDKEKIMVMAAADRIGHGDDELGRKLMISFIKTLKEMGPSLWRLVFVNSGVKLTIAGSQVLAELQELETSGIKILVCGTCLTHFDLLSEKQVGETTNMLDIVTALELSDKVINI
jgi:selenium metabolism protein YedF